MNKNEALYQLLKKQLVWFGENTTDSISSDYSKEEFFFNTNLPFGMQHFSFGTQHEWFYEPHPGHCFPPFFILGTIIKHSLAQNKQQFDKRHSLVWVDRRCFPTSHFLHEILPECPSLFVHTQNREQHLWAIIQALHAPSTLAVIADGKALNIAATRRLQLAARQGNSLCFLIRPLSEQLTCSFATSKWKISAFPSPTTDPAWLLELLYYRGMRIDPAAEQIIVEQTQQGLRKIKLSAPLPLCLRRAQSSRG